VGFAGTNSLAPISMDTAEAQATFDGTFRVTVGDDGWSVASSELKGVWRDLYKFRCGKVFLALFYTNNLNVSQDRLGKNTGKPEKRHVSAGTKSPLTLTCSYRTGGRALTRQRDLPTNSSLPAWLATTSTTSWTILTPCERRTARARQPV
jgi:arylamine N-acetyltransferase